MVPWISHELDSEKTHPDKYGDGDEVAPDGKGLVVDLKLRNKFQNERVMVDPVPVCDLRVEAEVGRDVVKLRSRAGLENGM